MFFWRNRVFQLEIKWDPEETLSESEWYWHFIGAQSSVLPIFFFKLINLFIYFWLCWVFVSVWGLSLVAASGGHSSSRCVGLSLSRPLPLRSTGSRRTGSVVVAHGPSCSVACGIFPDQGSNLCPLHWQADSQPLRHQGSPCPYFTMSWTHVAESALVCDWCSPITEGVRGRVTEHEAVKHTRCVGHGTDQNVQSEVRPCVRGLLQSAHSPALEFSFQAGNTVAQAVALWRSPPDLKKQSIDF